MGASRLARSVLAGASIALATSAAVAVDLAGACSCVFVEPRDSIESGAPALIGRVVAKRPVDDATPAGPGYEYRVRVEREFNARLGGEVAVAGGYSSATCGVDWQVGDRVGAFLGRIGGRWTTGACSAVRPAELALAARPFPRPLGRGRPSLLLGGRFGSARLMALDGRGRVLAYGFGRGTVRRISICPGSARSVELADRGARAVVAIRSLRSLRVLRSMRLPRSARLSRPDWLYGSTSDSAAALACADRAGSSVFAAVVDERAHRARVFEVRGRRALTLVDRRGASVALGPGTAYVGTRDRVLSIGLRDRDAHRVTAVHRAELLAASHDGRRLAVLDREGVRAIDLVSGETRSLRVRDVRTLAWLGPNRLLAGVGRGARIYDSQLRLLRRHRFKPARQVRVGRRLLGTNRYRLVALNLRDGRRAIAATLPDPRVFELVATPGAPPLHVPGHAPRLTAAAAPSCRLAAGVAAPAD
jgi:hypothetical protein